MKIITENQLDEWVRGNAQDAQGVIVELVWRLVAASSPKPKERRFPLGDSIGQPGPDGFLHTDFSFNPFVPEGRSFWEIGTGIKAGSKATNDYKDLITAIPEDVRRTSTFVFVTPLSGRRGWPHTRKKDAQAAWVEKRRQRQEWKDVRVIDGSVLIDWLQHWPAVERWLANAMGLPGQQLQTPEDRWSDLRTIGYPPPLTPQVFLLNRTDACEKLNEIFSGNILELKLDTYFPSQVSDFVAAFIANINIDINIDVVGRCIIIAGVDGWNTMTTLRDSHVLIADFDIDEDSAGTKLLEKARRSGHAVIYGGLPGGIPHPHRVTLRNPTDYQIREALELAGYNPERARTLARKSNGNLSSLLRCLQNLSLIPEWAQGTEAGELVIAELLGAWSETSEADKKVAENLSKKAYGEWIGKIREIAISPATPLIQRDGNWKFVSRYEGWYAFGPRIFDDHLDGLRAAAVRVLRERDPQFELSPDQRYAASIYGKTLTHSYSLRNGIAESLALIGSHHRALISCSPGKAEATAILSVREILADADWILWASLNNLLPLFAEAAPEAFLEAVEKALNSNQRPFDSLFVQESGGLTGRTYINGLLWALETLAWDEKYLVSVVVILGELAARDPGGKWGNRPDNSLSTILIPWLPQTCAPIAKRKAAVETLIQEFPDVAWRLLLSLLPQLHQSSSGSRKPRWRVMIPEDWPQGVTRKEEMEQIVIYTDLAISLAMKDLSKLADLIDRLAHLPAPAQEQILAFLRSDAIISMPQAERLRLWTELVDLVTKHKRFADAAWAMNPDLVDKIAAVSERLSPESPAFRHRRLFSEREFDLYEEKGKHAEQRIVIENRRQKAVLEILAIEGIQALMEFTKAVDLPWRVGFSFGVVAENNAGILPDLLEAENKSLAQFAGGFVRGRFGSQGWRWVDGIDFSEWTFSQRAQFLTYLPFTSDTWKRSARLLGNNDNLYWTKVIVNPHEAEKDHELAIELLIKKGRPYAAITCLNYLQHNKKPLNNQQAVSALLAALESSESPHSIDAYAIVEVIKALQDDQATHTENLFQIEWLYLQLLDRDLGAYPKLLEQRLADDPEFFCEVIRLVFLSKTEERPVEEPTGKQKSIATNAYRLLDHWRTPPGIREDGTYNGDSLNEWLKYVKASCTKSGHLEIALTMVGNVLIHTPSDPDGLWIHQSAAAALNARDASRIREGFKNELFNSRGTYTFTSGREERQIAEKYRKQADEVETYGYHRLAISLRQLASVYDTQAEREATRDIFTI
jgi:hypothetical protein